MVHLFDEFGEFGVFFNGRPNDSRMNMSHRIGSVFQGLDGAEG